MDSNHDSETQILVSYHWTTSQKFFKRLVIPPTITHQNETPHLILVCPAGDSDLLPLHYLPLLLLIRLKNSFLQVFPEYLRYGMGDILIF